MTTRKLRIRHSTGSTTLEIKLQSTAGEVAKLISSSPINIPIEEQAWKGGFPPRPISFNFDDPFDMDLIHVNKGEASISSSPPPSSGPTNTTPNTTTTTTTTNIDNNNNESSSLSLPSSITIDDIPTDEPGMIDPDGYVVRRVIDADNSCLFNSIGYCIEKSRSYSDRYRQMIKDTVLSDPDGITTYTDAFLEGKTPKEYSNWIMNRQSWGGQIELSIFSKVLQTEIAAFDVIRNRYDVYGTDGNYRRRIMVLFDGIHYDSLVYTFDLNLPEEMDVTQFSPNDSIAMDRAVQLCNQQHNNRSYTDTSNFTIRCLVCQRGLKGQAEATIHAQNTGHTNFAEY